MNSSRNGPGTLGPRPGSGFGIRWEFITRIHCKRDAIKPRVESHFPNSDVELVAALYVCDGAGGFARVGRRSTARSRPLRVADLRLLKPGCGLQQSEMCHPRRRPHREQNATAKQRVKPSHVNSPFINPLESAEDR